MFDLFSVTPNQVNEALQVHAVNYTTLIILLQEKGIVTGEEIAAARAKATHHVDQIVAEKREEMDKEFDEKHPGIRQMFGKLMGD